MSFQLMSWASKQHTGSASRKAVLLALANRANHDTGLCCPSVERIAEETEIGERTVRQALADLEAGGFIARERTRRGDGSYGVYRYSFPLADPAPPPADIAADPPAESAAQEEPGSSLTVTPPVSPPRRLPTLDRKPVRLEHERLGESVLAAWNEQAGSNFHSKDHLRPIVMRIREHPEFGIDEHRAIIAAAFAKPWWKDHPPGVQVVYGNGAIFERTVEAAKRVAAGQSTDAKPPPRRYGRGMTTREMLDTIPGGNT